MIPEKETEPENMEDEDEGYMHEERELTVIMFQCLRNKIVKLDTREKHKRTRTQAV